MPSTGFHPPLNGEHPCGAALQPECLFAGRVIEERGYQELLRRGSEGGTQTSDNLACVDPTGGVGIAGAVELNDLGVARRFTHEMSAYRRDRRFSRHPKNDGRVD